MFLCISTSVAEELLKLQPHVPYGAIGLHNNASWPLTSLKIGFEFRLQLSEQHFPLLGVFWRQCLVLEFSFPFAGKQILQRLCQEKASQKVRAAWTAATARLTHAWLICVFTFSITTHCLVSDWSYTGVCFTQKPPTIYLFSWQVLHRNGGQYTRIQDSVSTAFALPV